MRTFHIWRRISKSDFTFCKSKVITRFLSSHPVPEAWTRPFDPPSPEFDWQYLCDDKNRAAIEENIINRKGVGDINQVVCRTCIDLIVLYQCTLQNLFTLSHVLIMKKDDRKWNTRFYILVSDITMEDISKRERCKFYILYIKNWAQFNMNAPIDKLHGLLIKTSNNLVGC